MAGVTLQPGTHGVLRGAPSAARSRLGNEHILQRESRVFTPSGPARRSKPGQGTSVMEAMRGRAYPAGGLARRTGVEALVRRPGVRQIRRGILEELHQLLDREIPHAVVEFVLDALSVLVATPATGTATRPTTAPSLVG
jgi:hypothetical protein